MILYIEINTATNTQIQNIMQKTKLVLKDEISCNI